MRIATWNVNSLRVRLPHLLDWLRDARPDAACLQETKTEDANFPVAELRAAGYESVFCGQKSYNGVAILSRTPIADVRHGIPDFADDPKRCIHATINGIRVVCLYAPNGEAPGTDKYAYKLRWYAQLARWLGQLNAPNLAVLGDMNVAPEDRDVHNPKRWEGKIHVSEPERAALRTVLDAGLVDAFRLFPQPEKSFTWWDYRLKAFERGWGLRIDLAMLTPALAKRCTACTIDLAPRRRERPSDHAPVVVELS
ncbi:MAG TPA: exodeoxyribonuclease III [Burkholderiales bacterium]|nr:exodeoxyribonuclease III [Burkholderiales bacterium]